ncbi:MAG: VTT domain-containing protein [Rubrivivax sp.]|nr:VTT domain-containing protein [Rubrivivax sp.]
MSIWASLPDTLLLWQQAHPLLAPLAFAVVFVLLSALSLPGCGPLALMAGAAWGLAAGTLAVGLASTVGATLAFLAARRLARAAPAPRPGSRLARARGWLDRGEALLERGGPLALVWLRLVPIVPYPLLNPLLGLTRISLRGFVVPSFFGLLIGSLPWVSAGQALSKSWHAGGLDVPSTAVAASLFVLTPLLAARMLRRTAA